MPCSAVASTTTIPPARLACPAAPLAQYYPPILEKIVLYCSSHFQQPTTPKSLTAPQPSSREVSAATISNDKGSGISPNTSDNGPMEEGWLMECIAKIVLIFSLLCNQRFFILSYQYWLLSQCICLGLKNWVPNGNQGRYFIHQIFTHFELRVKSKVYIWIIIKINNPDNSLDHINFKSILHRSKFLYEEKSTIFLVRSSFS